MVSCLQYMVLLFEILTNFRPWVGKMASSIAGSATECKRDFTAGHVASYLGAARPKQRELSYIDSRLSTRAKRSRLKVNIDSRCQMKSLKLFNVLLFSILLAWSDVPRIKQHLRSTQLRWQIFKIVHRVNLDDLANLGSVSHQLLRPSIHHSQFRVASNWKIVQQYIRYRQSTRRLRHISISHLPPSAPLTNVSG